MATTWIATPAITVAGGALTLDGASVYGHAMTADAVDSGIHSVSLTYTAAGWSPDIVLTQKSTLPNEGTEDAWVAYPDRCYFLLIEDDTTAHLGKFPENDLIQTLSADFSAGASVGLLANLNTNTLQVLLNGTAIYSTPMEAGTYYFGVSLFTQGDTLSADLSDWGLGGEDVTIIGDAAGIMTFSAEAGEPVHTSRTLMTFSAAAGPPVMTHVIGAAAGSMRMAAYAGANPDVRRVGMGTTWGSIGYFTLDGNTLYLSGPNGGVAITADGAVAEDGLQVVEFDYDLSPSWGGVYRPPTLRLWENAPEFTINTYQYAWDLDTGAAVQRNEVLKPNFGIDIIFTNLQPVLPVPSRQSGHVRFAWEAGTVTIHCDGQLLWIGSIMEQSYFFRLELPSTDDPSTLTVDLSRWGALPPVPDPRVADPLSPTRFICDLSAPGKGTLRLPMSSFQARTRTGDPSYLSVVIPDAPRYASAIAARAGGLLIVYSVQTATDGDPLLREVARGMVDSIRPDQGPSSHSITITAYKYQSASRNIVTLHRWSYRGQTNTGRRFRAPVQTDIQAGDTVIAGAESFVVREIAWTVSPRSAEMELAE